MTDTTETTATGTSGPDPTAPVDLTQIRSIKAALNELPPVVPEPQLYEQILRAHEAQRERAGKRFLRYPLATAAAVFCVTLIGSALWLPDLRTSTDTPTPLVQPVDGLAHLVSRSRQLESAIQTANGTFSAPGDTTSRALLFRIADIDSELENVQQETMHPDLRKRLLRQRVELLETLMEIQRYQLREQADL